MKKKVLFIMNNLTCGGAENALVSLLQIFDYTKYDVDLLLMKNEGPLLSKLPQQVNLLESPEEFLFFDTSFKKSIAKSFRKLRFDIIFLRILYVFYVKPEKNSAVKDQKLWKIMKICMPVQPQKYDVAISYLQGIPNCYNVNKVWSEKKIGFIRTDYEKAGFNPVQDRPYFKKLTALLAVSKSCENILQQHFSDLPIHIGTMQNIFSYETIKKLANEVVDEDFSGISIVSMGRLVALKGFDLAIDACAVLVEKGFNIKWYILGEGQERQNLEKQIKNKKIQSNFFLIGQKDNPYPYLKNATIYVHTSKFEGKSRAIEEAKIMQKPIVVTNFPTVIDQIEHLETGYIVDINTQAIAEGIETLILNNELTNHLESNLKNLKINNEKELEILYDIIEID